METPPKFYTYIHASKPRGTLYVGSTGNQKQRTQQHKFKHQPNAFTTCYKVNMLVYFEEFATKPEALKREKQLKHYLRSQKISLIERNNPHWQDLAASWFNH